MSVQNAIEIEGDPTALYRLFSADGTLLYLGVTRDIAGRFAAHETKPWWPQVARKTMVWYGSREQALAAETAAILAERPLYNVAGIACDEIPAPRTGRRRNWAASVMDAEPLPPRPARAAKPPKPKPLKAGRPRFTYASIATDLEVRIRAGEFTTAGHVPSVAKLQMEYRTGVISVRRAVAILMSQGLVKQQGADPASMLKVTRQKPQRQETTEKNSRTPSKRNRPKGRPRGAPAVPNWCQSDAHPLAPGIWQGVSLNFPRRPAA
jgi:DNA-binding transcriptional regulator YhcF (GntR family)